MPYPWDRREGESEAAYAAFDTWLHSSTFCIASVDFSDHVEKKTGHKLTPATLKQYSANHKWKDRKRAYQSSLLNARLSIVSDVLARDEVKMSLDQAKKRRLAAEKAMKSLKLIDIDADAKIKDHLDFLAAIRQVMEIATYGAMDLGDQRSRISATVGPSQTGGSVGDDADLIPPIPPEPGFVQLGSPETEAVLEPTAGDLPGDS